MWKPSPPAPAPKWTPPAHFMEINTQTSTATPEGVAKRLTIKSLAREADVDFATMRTSVNCIATEDCGGSDLVDALKIVENTDYGQVIFGVIDVGDQQNWDKLDGNWSGDDIKAASDLNTTRELIEGLGASAEDAASLGSTVASVASRLAQTNNAWERLDTDLSWWQRNAGAIAIATVALSVLSFTPCSALCAGGAAVLATGTAVDTCSREGASIQCGAAVGSAALSVVGAGASSMSVTGKVVSAGSSRAGLTSYAASWDRIADTSEAVGDVLTGSGLVYDGFNQLPFVQVPRDRPRTNFDWGN